jgi:hypothetical protein
MLDEPKTLLDTEYMCKADGRSSYLCADRSTMNVQNLKDDRAKLSPATCHLII